MKMIIDKETVNDSIAKSMMSSASHDLIKEYELCVVLSHFDGGYNLTIHEFVGKYNLEPFIESDEFDDDYPVECAISDVLHTLMFKIWS